MGNRDLEERLAHVREFTAGSPFYERLGLELASVSEGLACIRMRIRPALHNADGIVHGGVLPSLADAAMANAVRSLCGSRARIRTAELSLHYLGAVRGGEVVAEGRVIKKGRSLSFAEADIRDGACRLVARATGTFVIDWERGRPGKTEER